MTEWLIVGLGNPGRAYARNRHNIGFMAVDALTGTYGTGTARLAFQGAVQGGVIDGRQVLFLKPETFMNLSGDAVGACARFFKVPPEKTVVLHDELEIAPGTVRIKQGGGHAGHNGLKSIDQHFGNNYWRVRLGIGHPGDRNLVSPHVLSDFTAAEQRWLAPLLDDLTANFPLLLSGQSGKLASLFTTPARPETEQKT